MKVLVIIISAAALIMALTIPAFAVKGDDSKARKEISVQWLSCYEVWVESADVPIHSVVFRYLDGTADMTNRYNKEPLGHALDFEEDRPIESIRVKLHNVKYSGPGLGPKFKSPCSEDDPSL